MNQPYLKQVSTCCAVLLLCSAASASADQRIVPGSRIGAVKIGASGKALTSALGKEDSGDAALGHYWGFWYSHTKAQPGTLRRELDVYSTAQEGVQQIRTTSPSFRTAEGITVGSSLRQVRRQYQAVHPAIYYQSKELHGPLYIYDDVKQGIALEIWRGKNGRGPAARCVAIWIHRRGARADQIYSPLFEPKPM